MKRESIIKLTKYILDFMFFAGILVTVTLPLTVKWIGNWMPVYKDRYAELTLCYFVLGIGALVILRELRRIFATVIKKDCFVRANVESLNKMFKWSIFIVIVSILRSFLYRTTALYVIILVFIIAGLFCKVLAYVFEEAVAYKEENDFTI